MIKAFLFDMDGVLAESEELSVSIGVSYFRSIGIDADSSVFSNYLGGGERIFFDGPAKELGLTGSPYDYNEASAFFRREYEKRASGLDISLPGAKEIVRSARAEGIMTAVASSAPGWKVMMNIKGIGLSPDDFDFIASGEDIKRNKPFPDIYTLCLIRLGLDGSEAIVFEDSIMGIKSAKSAGCHAIGTGSTYPVTDLYAAGADAAVSDLSAFPSALDAVSAIEDREGKKKRVPITEYLVKHALRLARNARINAYAPYSGFKVGAAVVTSSGKIYTGCNVENSSYGATICAERNAVTTAIAVEGRTRIEMVAVFTDSTPPSPPCAICLQVLAEFAYPDTLVVLSSGTEEVRMKFSELLPKPFTLNTI